MKRIPELNLQTHFFRSVSGEGVFWWYPEESNLDARRRKHQQTSCYQVLAAQNPDICLHLTHKVMNFQKVNDTESRIFLNLQCYTFQTTQDSLLIGKKKASWTIFKTWCQLGNPSLSLWTGKHPCSQQHLTGGRTQTWSMAESKFSLDAKLHGRVAFLHLRSAYRELPQ